MPGGGLASYNLAGVAAEQPTGGGFAYAGRAAAEQPTPGGLLAGDTSNLDAEEAQIQHDIAALCAQYKAMSRGEDIAQPGYPWGPSVPTYGASMKR